MADLVNTFGGGFGKLNHTNYEIWSTCMMSYLEGQDLWETVGGSDTTPPSQENAEALRKWKIKAGKAMYALKISVDPELLGHIKDARTPKDAWDTLASLFSKTNDARLQMLENELMTTTQEGMTISQYFKKIKDLCQEISLLDPESKINEPRMRRIIIRGLKPEYNGFIMAIRGWPTQPTLVELENLLANQETLMKQMSGVSINNSEEALFSSGRRRDGG